MGFDLLRRFGPALIVAYAAWLLYQYGADAGRAEITAQWQQAQQAYDRAVREREDTFLADKARAAGQRDEELKDANATIARVRADAGRLRVALADAIRRENGGTAGGAGSPGTVLADVCSRAGETAARLAAYADRERIARQECQRAWPR